ncbi:Uma2 family endonuclease [Streptomyces sp. NPDC058107]|uniref:Uma2 family endonuclease n=1 Tax=Streptomyces sp. NPDC058107 TaxID=3346343 RepID=UPI0036E2AD91
MSVALDHTGPWTVDAVLALPEDRTVRYELLGESLVMSPAPGLRHQRASYRLHVALDTAARAAGAPVEILEAINVTLPSGLVVPDIVVADAGATSEDAVSIDADAVQLVVELVSPGNKTMDRKFKPMLYAEAAIPHYWRLEFDPAPGSSSPSCTTAGISSRPPPWRSPSRSTRPASPGSNHPAHRSDPRQGKCRGSLRSSVRGRLPGPEHFPPLSTATREKRCRRAKGACPQGLTWGNVQDHGRGVHTCGSTSGATLGPPVQTTVETTVGATPSGAGPGRGWVRLRWRGDGASQSGRRVVGPVVWPGPPSRGTRRPCAGRRF